MTEKVANPEEMLKNGRPDQVHLQRRGAPGLMQRNLEDRFCLMMKFTHPELKAAAEQPA